MSKCKYCDKKTTILGYKTLSVVCQQCRLERISYECDSSNYYLYTLTELDTVVYAGITINPALRFGQHCISKTFDYMVIKEGFITEDEARIREKDYIITFKPELNRCYITSY